MKNKRILALLLAMVMTMSLITVPAFAAEGNAEKTANFSDTASHWAEKAIDRWAQYDVVKGSEGKFNPDGDLTRAELATILSNLLGLNVKAENTYADVKDGEWYADAVLKCTAAGIMKGDGKNAMPNAKISRQESMVMVARALGIKPSKTVESTAFKDADTVADWAAAYMTVMTKNGVISGVGDGMLAPKANMKRAAVVTILDKSITDYITVAGTYDKVVGTGIVAVKAADVVLKGNKIAGSLLVTEGVGNGDFTLDSTDVAGDMTVRGGGINSIHVMGTSKVPVMSVARLDGAVRVVTSGSAAVGALSVGGGKEAVVVEGKFDSVQATNATPVTLQKAEVKTVTATGKGADITVDKTSKVETVATAQENTKITVAGTVTNVAATASATGVSVMVSKGGTTANVTTAAPNSNITVAGTVTNMSATKEAAGVSMNVSEGGNAKNVITAAPNSTIYNDGKMGTVSVSKDATTAKIVVGEKSTMERIVNENKENLTVTTAAAEKAAQEAAAAKAEAEKAAADKVAADKAASEAKTAEEKAAAEAAQKAAKEAADKAAADKAASEKAAADAKAAADKAAADAANKTENKPVVVPDPPKVDEGGSGEIIVPEPPKPVDPPSPPTPNYAGNARRALHEAIVNSVAGANTALKNIATLALSANAATVTVDDGNATALAVLNTNFLAPLLGYNEIYEVKVGTQTVTIDRTNAATEATSVKNVMRAVGTAAGLTNPTATTPISGLKNHTITIVIYGSNTNVHYSDTYTVEFK